MITNENISKVFKIVENHVKKFGTPYVTEISLEKRDLFKILVSTILSARTKDEVTKIATERLFSKIKNVYDLQKLDEKEIEELIYPVGFYRNKAKLLKKLANVLIEEFGGKVPQRIEDLTKLPGVGRKTANLVLILGFNKDGICVDTHVHRIVNRWGYVKTKIPEETEMELRKKLPKKFWKRINTLLVSFGQNICKPVSPKCSVCGLKDICPKIGVKIFR